MLLSVVMHTLVPSQLKRWSGVDAITLFWEVLWFVRDCFESSQSRFEAVVFFLGMAGFWKGGGRG